MARRRASTLAVGVAVCAVLLTGVGARRNIAEFQTLVWGMIDNGFQSNVSYEVVDHIINFYFPASKAVENEVCRRHSESVIAAVKRNRPWALRMLDASSKVPSGLLMGNTLQLGNYDECLNVQNGAEVSSPGHFRGQHCMVTTDVYGDYLEPSNQTTLPDGVDVVLRDFAFGLGTQWSVCIPSSCTYRDLEAHLRSVLSEMVGGATVVLGERSCRSKAHPTVLTRADWFAISLFLVFAILVVVSTVYDIWYKKTDSRSKLLLAFSLYTNGRRLLTVSAGGEELKALHAIRTFSMIWVVVGHTFDNSLDIPAVNSETLAKILSNWQHAFLMNYRLAVDSFLLLSGLLLCFGFLRKAKRDESFSVLLYYLHRYIRLTPAYAAMILLTATLLAYTDDGPIWEQHPLRERDICQHYWWVNLIYLNNYVSPLSSCMTQSWYLALDMQLYFLSPLLVYPLWRWRRFGKVLLGLVGFTGLVIAFLVGYIYEFNNEYSDADINVLEYLPTHTRFTPWVLGVAMGYLLHSYRNRTIQLSRSLVAVGWVCCCLLLLMPVVVNHLLQNTEHTYNRWHEAFNSALNKPAFALGVAWLIFACNNGYGGFVNTIFSWKLFTILSRLTYCAYLVHYAVILWLAGSIKAPLYLSDRTIAIKAFNVTLISFLGALLLSLVFEAPALNIEKILLDKDGSRDDKTAKYAVVDRTNEDTTRGNELV